MFPSGWVAPVPDQKTLGLAALALHQHLSPAPASPWQSLGAWRLTLTAGRAGVGCYWSDGSDAPIKVVGQNARLEVTMPDGARIGVEGARLTAQHLTGRTDGAPFTRQVHLLRSGDCWQVHLSAPDGMLRVPLRTLEDQHLQRASSAAGGADTLSAPMPGAVVEIRVTPGDRVSTGETLMVLEAMKLLQSLPAPVAGVVAEIYCAPGDTVAGGAPLVRLDPEDRT